MVNKRQRMCDLIEEFRRKGREGDAEVLRDAWYALHDAYHVLAVVGEDIPQGRVYSHATTNFGNVLVILQAFSRRLDDQREDKESGSLVGIK
ncbi:hypothetical protein [Thiosocius teredinicola]|uniref:hypothetical protein n=1 Tax=Thiosocius teredinicola TaxID=1973002 RepID=UPI000F774DD7